MHFEFIEDCFLELRSNGSALKGLFKESRVRLVEICASRLAIMQIQALKEI